MSPGLGSVQKQVLAVMGSKPDQVWLFDDVTAEIYGASWSSVQRQTVYNALRSLARRGLVELAAQGFNQWGQPEARARARLLQGP